MTDKEYWSPEELAMKKALNSIREEYPDFWKDFEEFTEESEPSKTVDFPERREEIAKPDLEKIRQRKFRRRLIVACFLGVCVLSTALAIFINSDTAHAVKFAMEKKYYQAKGWVQATESIEGKNDVIIVSVLEEEKLYNYKELWNELKVPEYMTSGYEFVELCIEKFVNGYVIATYEYRNKDDNSIVILLRNIISDNNTQLWIKAYDVCEGQYQYKVWEDETVNKSGIEIIMKNITVSVCGTIDENELKKIVNGLE